MRRATGKDRRGCHRRVGVIDERDFDATMPLKTMQLPPAIWFVVPIAMVIAVIAPFDVAFTAVTMHSAVLRAAVIAIVALIGAAVAGRLGLRLEGHGVRSPVVVGVAFALAVAIYVALLDGIGFRWLLPADYVTFLRTPLPSRFSYFMLRAFNENVIYRLFVFPLLTWAALRTVGRKAPVALVILACAILTQMLNIGTNVVAPSAEPLTAVRLIYDVLRYVLPGTLWALVFWRYGFVIAEVASVTCHLFLQPLFSVLI
ncbi:MAG: hypothetical protein JF593_10100 [Novosphingobium sp.]|nr:hypothetical protein [Novosphingobium sp.]